MALYTTLASLSQTPASNAPDGSVDAPSTIDDQLRLLGSFTALLRDGKPGTAEVDVASAATTDVGAANSSLVRVTGTTTITSFGTNYTGPRLIRFAGILTLTHNATTLILPGGANITTAAGDTCIAAPIGSSAGWQVLSYQRAATAPGAVSGTVAIANGGTGQTTAAAALTALGGAPLASPTFTGTPAAPTATYGTNTTQLATTAYALAAANGTSSLGATSGYVKFSNGLTVQYGVTNGGVATTGGTETYPTAFANSCTAIAWTNNNTNSAGFVSAKNAANFTWACGASTVFNYIAIGY